MNVPTKLPETLPTDALHVVSVSGGKDSTCTYLLAIELLGPDGFIAVFADTGWEHEDTYKYVEGLPEAAGGPEIEWVRMVPPSEDALATRKRNLPKHFEKRGVSDEEAISEGVASLKVVGNPFKDLVMMRGGFPTSQMRFCTEHLKIVPMQEQVMKPARRMGMDVVSWQGTRAEESPSRALLPTSQMLEPADDEMASMHAWRPILDWKLEDVKAFAASKGVPLNPLYSKGFSRVGCYPCIFARQDEVSLIADLNPERIDEIAAWEETANKRRAHNHATFFPANKVKANGPGPYHFRLHGIGSKVNWAKQGTNRKNQRKIVEELEISNKAKKARLKAIRNAEKTRAVIDKRRMEAESLEEVFSTACDTWGACE